MFESSKAVNQYLDEVFILLGKVEEAFTQDRFESIEALLGNVQPLLDKVLSHPKEHILSDNDIRNKINQLIGVYAKLIENFRSVQEPKESSMRSKLLIDLKGLKAYRESF